MEEELSVLAFLELVHKLDEGDISEVLEISHVEDVIGVLRSVEHIEDGGTSGGAGDHAVSGPIVWVILHGFAGADHEVAESGTNFEEVHVGLGVDGSEAEHNS